MRVWPAATDWTRSPFAYVRIDGGKRARAELWFYSQKSTMMVVPARIVILRALRRGCASELPQGTQ